MHTYMCRLQGERRDVFSTKHGLNEHPLGCKWDALTENIESLPYNLLIS